MTLLKCAVTQRRRPDAFLGSDTVIEVQFHIDREVYSAYKLGSLVNLPSVVLNRAHSVNISTDR